MKNNSQKMNRKMRQPALIPILPFFNEEPSITINLTNIYIMQSIFYTITSLANYFFLNYFKTKKAPRKDIIHFIGLLKISDGFYHQKNQKTQNSVEQNLCRSTFDSPFLIIYFSLISTSLAMFNDQREQFQRQSAFRKLQGRSQSFDYNVLDPSQSFSTEMMQVINAQNSLIMKLLQRQNVLYNQLNKRFSSSDSGSGSNTRANKNTQPTRFREYNNSEQFSLSSNRSGQQNGTKAQPKIIENQRIFQGYDNVNNRVAFKSDMESSPEDGGDLRQGESAKFSEKRKQTETKNMIKNFAKAIFSFIRKNREKRLQVLRSLQIPQDDFMRVYDSFKGHIHSITELRSLWTPEGNLFHKAFRILSYIYLQRHCLEKTFNSRVQNYSVHLKYRQRLLKALQFPEEFTALKVN